METQKLNSINFSANMSFPTGINNIERWGKISNNFSKQTRRMKEYQLDIFEKNNGGLSILVNRGTNDNIGTRILEINMNGYENLKKLSDTGITQKFKKLLKLIVRHDNLHDNLPSYINKLEKSIGFNLDEFTNTNIYKSIYSDLEDKHYQELVQDKIFTNYTKAVNIL